MGNIKQASKLLVLCTIALLISTMSFSQMLYFHHSDSVQQICGDEILNQYIFDEDLLSYVADQYDVSFFIIDGNDCYLTEVNGLPLCTTCSYPANRVMQTAYRMSFYDNFIIQGSCWGFVNSVFTRIESDTIHKKDIYFEKKPGPYAPIDMLQPGDWIYHVNYEYNQIEHSAIFIGWIDYEKGLAITLSYVGLNRKQSGKFGIHNLNSVYAIFRMEKDN